MSLNRAVKLTSSDVKVGDLVVVKDGTKVGIVLSVSAYVPYEGSYASVVFDEKVRSINTTLLTKVE